MARRHDLKHPLDVLDALGRSERFVPVREAVDAALSGGFARLEVRAAGGLGTGRLLLDAHARAGTLGLWRDVGTMAEAGDERAGIEWLIEQVQRRVPAEQRHEVDASPAWRLQNSVWSVTRQSPLVLCIDDFHKAGPEMQRAVLAATNAMERDPGSGFAVIVASSGAGRGSLVGGGPDALYEPAPLAPAEVRTVVKQFIPSCDRDVIELITDLVRGNAHWLHALLGDIIEVAGSSAALAERVRSYAASGWGSTLVGTLSATGRTTLQALAACGRVAPLSPAQLGVITGLDEAQVDRALGEAASHVAVEHGMWNLVHELSRTAILEDTAERDRQRWHERAASVAQTPLERAMHIQWAAPGAIDDEVSALRSAARGASVDVRRELLTTALLRARGSEARAIGRDLAALALRTGRGTEALGYLSAGPPDAKEDPDGFASWHVLNARALAAQPVPPRELIATELRKALEELPPETADARTAIMLERAGKAWMPSADIEVTAKAIAALPLPEAGRSADDARLLWAAADHLALQGGPAARSRRNIRTVLSILRACIAGEGVWSAWLADDPDRICQIQWLLLCCDAWEELDTFEPQVGARLEHTAPGAYALHRVLVGHRLMVEGDLDRADAVIASALPHVEERRLNLVAGIHADVLVEQGRIADAAQAIACAPGPAALDNVGDWYITMAQARVDRNQMRIRQSLEALAQVGRHRPGHPFRNPAFQWRVQLLRLLHRYRYHELERPSWTEVIAPIRGPERDEKHFLLQLLSTEMDNCVRWGAPVPVARANRVAAEMKAAEDLEEAGRHRRRAVRLLGKADGETAGRARLEYAVSVYELARQFMAEAEQCSGAEARELRAEASRLARSAGQLAFEAGSAQLWLRAWDLHSIQGHGRRGSGNFPPYDVDKSEIPFVDPKGMEWAELAATGLDRQQLFDLLGKAAGDKHLGKVRSKLTEVAKGTRTRLNSNERGTPTQRRIADWLEFRDLQFDAFRRARAKALGTDADADHTA